MTVARAITQSLGVSAISLVLALAPVPVPPQLTSRTHPVNAALRRASVKQQGTARSFSFARRCRARARPITAGNASNATGKVADLAAVSKRSAWRSVRQRRDASPMRHSCLDRADSPDRSAAAGPQLAQRSGDRAPWGTTGTHTFAGNAANQGSAVSRQPLLTLPPRPKQTR